MLQSKLVVMVRPGQMEAAEKDKLQSAGILVVEVKDPQNVITVVAPVKFA